MVGLLRVGRDSRKTDTGANCPVAQACFIAVPDPLAKAANLMIFFKLRKQERRQQIRGQIAGADVHPSVLVYLAAIEAASIRALFADDLGSLDIDWIVHNERSALAADYILGLVKT